ncbi:hypothetical protein ACIQK9_19500 [Streptomyces hydrogenans]|uniref:hypothetical protein n=1 Tax=Streptomyces hydrogenans TaxID=1873719 RepID=UPI003828B922
MNHSPLDHRYRGEHPIRTVHYLFRPDRARLAGAVAVFFAKHAPVESGSHRELLERDAAYARLQATQLA